MFFSYESTGGQIHHQSEVVCRRLVVSLILYWPPHVFHPEREIQGVLKKTEQIGNRSQICKAAVGMKFLAQVHYFGTYDVE